MSRSEVAALNGVHRRTEFLPFARHGIDDEEIAAVVDTLRSEWITSGPRVQQFEDAFAAYLGSPSALAVSSCTAALHLALVVFGVGPGDRVITSPMTFCSSAHVIEHVGARPIFVDVEPDTLNIAPDRIAEVLAHASRRDGEVKAILPVHLYGHPCDLDAILGMARDHGLAMIEDAAHALTASYKGRPIGGPAAATFPPRLLTCFSFYATKNLTTAEGGMLVGPPELMAEARVWSLHGMSRDAWKRYSAEGSWYYEVVHPGFKYNMTDLQAAIGLQQLRKIPQFQHRRREIVRRYTEAFTHIEALQPPVQRPEVEHAWHLYVIRLNTEQLRFPGTEASPSAIRARFIAELAARKIGTSVHFIPVHIQPYYRDKYGFRPEDFPTAYREYERMVSLPLYPRMSDADVDDVITTVADVVARYRR